LEPVNKIFLRYQYRSKEGGTIENKGEMAYDFAMNLPIQTDAGAQPGGPGDKN
jgi:hypothetical protein